MYIVNRHKTTGTMTGEENPSPVRDRFGVIYFDKIADAHAKARILNDREKHPMVYYVVKTVA